MRVKIGDTWYDSDDSPVGIQMSDIEWEFIRSGEVPKNKSFAIGRFETDAELVAWLREGRDQ